MELYKIVNFKQPLSKAALFTLTVQILYDFCDLNSMRKPVIKMIDGNGEEGGRYFGYYNMQNGKIHVNYSRCILPTYNGQPRFQSYPGNKTDRTIAGVLAHEFGHYTHLNKHSERETYLNGVFYKIVKTHQEPSITSYDGDIWYERIAESFRLFLLNPNLLKAGRPLAYAALRQYYKPVFDYPWQQAFVGAKNPEQYIHWCEVWIKKGNKVSTVTQNNNT